MTSRWPPSDIKKDSKELINPAEDWAVYVDVVRLMHLQVSYYLTLQNKQYNVKQIG